MSHPKWWTTSPGGWRARTSVRFTGCSGDELLLENAEGDERRRYYCLSRLGRRALKAEAEHLARLVAFVRARKLLSRGRRLMRTLVALLLRLYPARFRREFGADILATFNDRWHAG